MSRPRSPLLLPLLLLLLLAAPGVAQQQADSEALAAYKALRREYDAAQTAFRKALDAAGTPEEKQRVVREKLPSPNAYAPRFMRLARRYPKSPVALDCLVWVIEHPADPATKEAALRAEAFKALGTRHIKDERLGAFCTSLVFAIDHASEEFLLRAMVHAPKDAVKARATASLAHTLRHRGRLVRQLQGDAEARKSYEQSWGKPTVDALLRVEPAVFERESEKYFEQVVRKYGGVRHPAHGTLGNLARAHLAALRDPVDVGRPAPEIEGNDLSGKPLRLSDYRGKVVLLDFWGSAYPPCRAQFAYERELVKRLAGKPFALLGVNCDADRSAVRKLVLAEGMSWRSWWDGGGVGGPVATRWEVDLWPTVLVLDHRGVVRALWTGWPERKALEQTLAKLILEAEGGE